MQHMLILIILLLVIALAFTLWKWPGGVHMTFSQHAAATRWSKVYYSVVFMVTLPMLLWFFIDWFVPERNVPSAFLWFALIAVTFQVLCTWFPEEGGRKTRIHRLLTAISGVALLPMMYILALLPNLTIFQKAWVFGSIAFMTVLLLVAVANLKGFKWALWLQIGYYASFFMTLLLVTYR